MYTNNGMYQGYEVESNKEYYKESSYKSSEGNGIVLAPIYECPQERVIHREFIHEVPHICPVNTRIVNHHIYKHTYSPCYTCSEENEVCNVNAGCECNF